MRVKDPEIGSPAKKSLSVVTDIEVVDSHTVKMKLSTSFADFPLNLTDYRLRMIPSGSGDTIGQTGIGTGPFVVEKFDAEGTTILKANPNYWEGAPGLAEVHVITISGSLSRHKAVIIPNIKAIGIPIIIAADARTKEFFTLGPKTSLIGISPLKE